MADDDRDHEVREPGIGLRQGQLSRGAAVPSAHKPGGAAARHRLRPSLECFPAASGDLYLLRPGETGDLVIRGPDALDRALIAELARRPQTLAELAARLHADPDTISAKLTALGDAGALAPAVTQTPLPPELAARFERQLPYLAEHGDAGAAQLALRHATVVMLGCGGLGTWALAALASAGVGRFVLIDDDTVELGNLNRQILYRTADLGRAKVERAAAWVRAFDPAIRVRAVRQRIAGADALAELLDGADALVQAADWPPHEITRWAARACARRGVPYITAGQVPPVLKVGPTYVPGRSACFACHEHALERDFPLYRELARHHARTPAPATTLGPASGIVGTLLGLELMHLLTGTVPVATEGRALLIDMRTLALRWEAIERWPQCPACQTSP